jgi:integrase
LVLIAASTGLRQSEIFGLKWGDIDFAQRAISVTRSIVYGVVEPCKTESSQKPVPLHSAVAQALMDWKRSSAYKKTDDWVFASRRHRGRKPIWGQAVLRRYIRPVALRVGIQKQFGWHTFRHYAESETMPNLRLNRSGNSVNPADPRCDTRLHAA